MEYRLENPDLDAVDNINEIAATVLDGVNEEEYEEWLDVLGRLAGGEALEEDHENLFVVVCERLRGEMLHHWLEQVESLVVIRLAGDQLLKHSQQAWDLFLLKNLPGAARDEGLQQNYFKN